MRKQIFPLNTERMDTELQKITETSEFKKYLLDRAIPRKVGHVTGHELKRARWQAQKWWSQWLFENIAKGNVEDFRILRFENDLISPVEIEEILELIRRKRRIRNSDSHIYSFVPIQRSSSSESDTPHLRRPLTPPDIGRHSSSSSDSDSNSDGSPPKPGVSSPRESINSNDSDPRPVTILSRRTSLSPREINDGFQKVVRTKSGRYNKVYEYNGVKLEISYILDNLLRQRYIGPPEDIEENVYLVGLRYQVIGIDNHYLSIPPKVASLFSFELFGSPFNTVCPYFSAFPEIESLFGAKGNYFLHPFPMEYNTFIFNPPYDETVIDMAITKLLGQMATRPMTVFCTLPLWDAESQRKCGLPMSNEKGDLTTNFEEARKFVPISRLLTCTYIKEHAIRLKERDNPFFVEYPTGKKFAPINIHFIILSNGPAKITMTQVLQAWV
jgi:hypothetical protein